VKWENRKIKFRVVESVIDRNQSMGGIGHCVESVIACNVGRPGGRGSLTRRAGHVGRHARRDPPGTMLDRACWGPWMHAPWQAHAAGEVCTSPWRTPTHGMHQPMRIHATMRGVEHAACMQQPRAGPRGSRRGASGGGWDVASAPGAGDLVKCNRERRQCKHKQQGEGAMHRVAPVPARAALLPVGTQ
jgi:hypothetical protein